ncbi:MAG TPA: hypothetical protein VM487_02075 [Phycisphaerae bacterium]|nr:hypothetical protein [Phycisphaerae bacterium]
MTLPFDIAAAVGQRGLAVFTASVDGQRITAERYSPGDGQARRRVARSWAADDRFRNGSPIPADDIATALEQTEFAVRDRIAAIQDEEDDDAIVREAAAYADDEIIIELAWNVGTGAPDFIVYSKDSGNIERAAQLDTAAGKLVPPSACTGIVTPGYPIQGSILLPTECQAVGTDDALRQDVAAFIDRYVELPGDAVCIASEYVLLTWVHDAFDELPYLSFRTADIGRGKSRALETVGAVCYRPMLAGGGSSAAALLRLLDLFGGTLVCDEFDAAHNTELAGNLNRILNQGFQRNRPLVKCDGESNTPRPFACFGPKVFALRKRLGDDATETRTISIWMRQRTRADIPINLPRVEFDRAALELRNRLLAYRFANLGRIHIDPQLADADLEDRYNQIALPLLAVAGTDAARRRIVATLKDQQGRVAADRSDSLAGAIFEAVLTIVRRGGAIRPGDVAQEANRRTAEIEGVMVEHLRKPITANKVGWVLKGDLELQRDRDEGGTVYRLRPERLEELAVRFGVTPETLPTLQDCQPARDCTPRNGLFDSAKRDSLQSGNPGNVPGTGGDLDEDAAERAARQAVEAEAERGASE